MFNKDTLKHSLLKKQTLAIISIIAVGSLFGVVYASGTIVSDTGITTGNLTVTGTCSGCGASEGSFTNYNTVILNTTSATQDTTLQRVQVGNDGTVMIQGNSNNRIVTLGGTTLYNVVSYGSAGGQVNQIDHSVTGEYNVIINGTGNGSVQVYKNNVFLKTLGVDFANFFGGGFSSSEVGVAISPDGHYITIVGEDTGAASDRIVIFRGS